MKTILLNVMIVFSASVAMTQPLCDFRGKDSLTIQVAADTITIWDLAACGNCASRFATSVRLASDTLYIVQEDTSGLMALCDCLFNLRTSFVGAPAGTYTAIIYRDWHRKYPGAIQPLLIGSIQFDYHPPGSVTFSYEAFQSSCITDGIDHVQRELPPSSALLPNYPNPFNPSTTIWYQTSATQFVEIKVYDLLGRDIETLVSRVEFPGLHTVTFGASPKLSSGAYCVRMQAGSFSQTRAMVLAR